MAKKRILVVDDEQEVVQALKIRLKSEGFEIITAFDGQEAIEKARESKPDLILLDIIMPYMDGLEVCKILKSDHRTKAIALIMVTAVSEEQAGQTALERGADGYVTKPFDKDNLLIKIRDCISKKAS